MQNASLFLSLSLRSYAKQLFYLLLLKIYYSLASELAYPITTCSRFIPAPIKSPNEKSLWQLGTPEGNMPVFMFLRVVCLSAVVSHYADLPGCHFCD